MQVGGPIRGHFVVEFEGLEEVLLSMLIAHTLNSEVIHNKGELNRLPGVGPETGSVGSLVAAMLGEALGQEFVGQDPRLGRAAHTLLDLHKNVTCVDEELEVLLVDDLLRDEFDVHFHVFETVQWGVQVECF